MFTLLPMQNTVIPFCISTRHLVYKYQESKGLDS